MDCRAAQTLISALVLQVSELRNRDHQVIIVTSGAVAFGKQKLRQEVAMSLSMRQTLSTWDSSSVSHVVE